MKEPASTHANQRGALKSAAATQHETIATPSRPATWDVLSNVSARGPSWGIQYKLAVNPPGDRFEKEADRVADQLVSGNGSPATTQAAEVRDSIQRSQSTDPMSFKWTNDDFNSGDSGDDEDEDEDAVLAQAKEMPGSTPQVTPHIEGQLSETLNSGGSPIPTSDRNFFERGLQSDFSGVRLHQGSQASQLTQSLGARALTVGPNVVMGEGQYKPDSTEGRRLLAHELTHVVQQGAAERKPQTPEDEA